MFVLTFRKPHTRIKQTATKLVASFEDSHPPTIWQIDLDKGHSFTITLQEQAGGWVLGQSLAKGEFTPAVHFQNHEAALAAYAVLQQAMMRSTFFKLGWLVRPLGITVAIILLGYLLVTGIAFLLRDLDSNVSPSNAVQAPEFKHGVPQSADDILQLPSP